MWIYRVVTYVNYYSKQISLCSCHVSLWVHSKYCTFLFLVQLVSAGIKISLYQTNTGSDPEVGRHHFLTSDCSVIRNFVDLWCSLCVMEWSSPCPLCWARSQQKYIYCQLHLHLEHKGFWAQILPPCEHFPLQNSSISKEVPILRDVPHFEKTKQIFEL